MPQKTTKPYEIYKRLFDIDAKPHKICIIGASGLTGLNITGIALNAKHEVIALVRSPQKFQNLIKDYLPEGQSTNKLSVLQCDLEHPNENLGKAIQFADTVIFSIANKNNMTDKAIGTPCTNGINAIVSLLKENPQTKKRFIFVSSSATFLEDLDKSGGMGSWFYKNVIIPKYMTETYDDLRYMEIQIKEHLMNNPMYNVTVVRPPYLVEMKPEVKFKVEDKPIKAPKLGVLKLGRYQLAYFLVKSIDDESTFGKAQYLAAK